MISGLNKFDQLLTRLSAGVRSMKNCLVYFRTIARADRKRWLSGFSIGIWSANIGYETAVYHAFFLVCKQSLIFDDAE